MTNDITTWDEGLELCEAVTTSRIEGVTSKPEAYRHGLTDGYLEALTEMGTASETEERNWKITHHILASTAFARFGDIDVRAAYERGHRDATIIDHALISALYDLGVIRRRCVPNL